MTAKEERKRMERFLNRKVGIGEVIVDAIGLVSIFAAMIWACNYLP